MRSQKATSVLFQITALFVLSSSIALIAVLSQSTILRTQTLQTLAQEIRDGETTLFEKTAQVARERMSYYAYSADPGQSSVWQLRGRRSPVEAIKSENPRRVEIVIGPIFSRLAQQQTINTLSIVSTSGKALYAFDTSTAQETQTSRRPDREPLVSAPDLLFDSTSLGKRLASGYANYAGRLQHYVIFPIFSNAKVLAYIYYGVDFNTLKDAFEIESSSTVWLAKSVRKNSQPLLLEASEQANSQGTQSAIFSMDEKSYALGKYGISTTLDGEQAIFFIKDISAAFDQGRRFQVSMLIGLVILLLVSSYFVFALLRRRLKPLGNAIEVLNDLSKGDLDSRVEHQRNDEIGRIGEAIDIFREKLIGFNVMNNEARRQRMKQQEEVLRQTSALVELLPGERRESIESEIQIIDAEIASTLNKQTDTSLSVGDDSVTKLFAASFSLLGQELSEQYRVLDEKVRSRTAELEQKSNEIAHALNQNEELLLNILPQSIADRMKQEESLIADYFPDSAILFADIVGFTSIAEKMGPQRLVNLLNGLFSQFDEFSDQLHLEKIKTIGDSYMVAGGVPVASTDHCHRLAQMALMMQQFVNEQPLFEGNQIALRVGLHTGPVIAGVIGKRKFVYDLWGDTVNIAARMESHGLPGKIHVSPAMYERIKDDFALQYRDLIEVKGKGAMATYWLLGANP